MNRLTYNTVQAETSIEVSEDKECIAIFHNLTNEEETNKIAEFSIEMVWDMVRDAIAATNVSWLTNPGLFRRKSEAAAGISHTNKLYRIKEKIPNKNNEICGHCGLTFGSHCAEDCYSDECKKVIPKDYCPGHQGRMDWDKGPGTIFKPTGEYRTVNYNTPAEGGKE